MKFMSIACLCMGIVFVSPTIDVWAGGWTIQDPVANDEFMLTARVSGLGLADTASTNFILKVKNGSASMNTGYGTSSPVFNWQGGVDAPTPGWDAGAATVEIHVGGKKKATTGIKFVSEGGA